VFEGFEMENRETLHMTLLDSPVERTYQYALKKLDDWYGDKLPTKFILRMIEHPCVEVKAYLSQKMKHALSELNETNPDLYIYYAKTLLYLNIYFLILEAQTVKQILKERLWHLLRFKRR